MYVKYAMLICNTATGLDIKSTDVAFRKQWLESSYLRDRVVQLAPLMDELDPHEPVFRAFTLLFVLLVLISCKSV